MCQDPLWALQTSRDQERRGLCPGGAHRVGETIHRSAKPGTWVGEASCLAGQGSSEGGAGGLWEEVALSSGLSDKQLLGVVPPRCGQRASLVC